jgi:hypothetical protein
VSERDDARRLLRELLPEVLGEVLGPADGNGNGQGHGEATGHAAPAVPAPPVAAVLRPSTWARPPEPGEVIGDNGGQPPFRSAEDKRGQTPFRLEAVALASDEDLDRFVRALAARLEDPREGSAIRSGALRFTLGRGTRGGSTGGGGPHLVGGAMRVERGAVTERTVARAAADGARLVLAPGAVLTPLGREKARALGVEIERERRC